MESSNRGFVLGKTEREKKKERMAMSIRDVWRSFQVRIHEFPLAGTESTAMGPMRLSAHEAGGRA